MIRIALDKDIDSINKLGSILNSNFSITYDLKSYIKDKNYYILVNDETKINAFLIIYKNLDYYELEVIVVDPLVRNQRIATKLLSYFIDNYTQKNESILLEVAVNNKIALNLYEKFDFKIINIRKKYYYNIDAYVMKKVI